MATKTVQTTFRLTEDLMARLEQEAKRIRMETGENVTVPELLRRYAASLPEVKKP